MAFVSGGPPLKLVGYVAAADYSAITNQYKHVYISTAESAGTPGKVTLCSSATAQHAVGILQNTPKAGMPAEVVVIGPTKVNCSSSAISAGGFFGTDASGQAAPYTPGTDTTKWISGFALETSTGVNQLISAYVFPPRLGTA